MAWSTPSTRRITPPRCLDGADVVFPLRHHCFKCTPRLVAASRKRTAPVVAALACTHYGYRKDLFAAAFREAGVNATAVNPNERSVDDLFGSLAAAEGSTENREVEVQFITRYAIPKTTLEALT